MRTRVVTTSDRTPKEPYYIFEEFCESLSRFDEVPRVLGWNEPWGGLMTKPRKLRDWIKKEGGEYDKIIVCDAWDIVFQTYPQSIIELARDIYGDAVVMNAERSCFPRGDLADRFADYGTPWKYPNSGFIIGSPEQLLAIIEHMKIDDIPDDHRLPDGSWFNPNDQEHYMLAFLDQPVPMVLDSMAYLCVACHGSALDEFGFDGPIENRLTHTYPGAFHFNGDAKNNVMPRILQHLKL